MSFAVRPNMNPGLISLADIPATVDADSVGGPTSCDMGLDTDGGGLYDLLSTPTFFSWFAPNSSFIGNNYWCRMTVNSGTALGGSATGSILALSSNRTWTLVRTGIGVNTSNVTLEIFSDSGGATVVATRSFQMVSEVS